MPTILFNAGHFFKLRRTYGRRTCPALSGVKIQIKSEITPDVAGQNDALFCAVIMIRSKSNNGRISKF